VPEARRKCLSCGSIAIMKTWLRNYNVPQIILILGLLLYVIPGLIFLAWAWGKYRCPKCGAIGKSVEFENTSVVVDDSLIVLDKFAQLERMNELRKSGALTEEEFQIEKNKLLGRKADSGSTPG